MDMIFRYSQTIILFFTLYVAIHLTCIRADKVDKNIVRDKQFSDVVQDSKDILTNKRNLPIGCDFVDFKRVNDVIKSECLRIVSNCSTPNTGPLTLSLRESQNRKVVYNSKWTLRGLYACGLSVFKDIINSIPTQRDTSEQMNYACKLIKSIWNIAVNTANAVDSPSNKNLSRVVRTAYRNVTSHLVALYTIRKFITIEKLLKKVNAFLLDGGNVISKSLENLKLKKNNYTKCMESMLDTPNKILKMFQERYELYNNITFEIKSKVDRVIFGATNFHSESFSDSCEDVKAFEFKAFCYERVADYFHNGAVLSDFICKESVYMGEAEDVLSKSNCRVKNFYFLRNQTQIIDIDSKLDRLRGGFDKLSKAVENFGIFYKEVEILQSQYFNLSIGHESIDKIEIHIYKTLRAQRNCLFEAKVFYAEYDSFKESYKSVIQYLDDNSEAH